MEAIRRENGAVLKENSLLHMELIKKDETCNEKVRRALAEMHKLESTVSELIFWKEQASQRYIQLEKRHDDAKDRLDALTSGSCTLTMSNTHDPAAQMDLTTVLGKSIGQFSHEETSSKACFNGADDRAAALQERLVGAESELMRMHKEVAAANTAIKLREGEVRRLHFLLDDVVCTEKLTDKMHVETKDNLIASLSEQVKTLTTQMMLIESGDLNTAKSDHTETEQIEGYDTLPWQSGTMRKTPVELDVSRAEAERTCHECDEKLRSALNEAASLREEIARYISEPSVTSLHPELSLKKAEEIHGSRVEHTSDQHVTSRDVDNNRTREAEQLQGELRRKVAATNQARHNTEMQSAFAIEEAKRAQKLIIEAGQELEQVQKFAESCNKRREESLFAAKEAAELLAKQEATIREQAADLESLQQRVMLAETEKHRLQSMIILSSENTNTQSSTQRVGDVEVHTLVSAATGLDPTSANAKTSRKITPDVEELRTTLKPANESAVHIESHLAVSIRANVRLQHLNNELVHELEVERDARNQAQRSLRVAEAAATAACAELEKAFSDNRRNILELKMTVVERDDARFDFETIAEVLRVERETLQAEMEAALGANRETENFCQEIDKLKTVVHGLDATREKLMLELKKANTEKLCAEICSSNANVLTAAERAKVNDANAEIARAKSTIVSLNAEKDRLETLLDARTEELAAANARATHQTQAAEDALGAVAAAEARCLAAVEVDSDMSRRIRVANDKLHQMSHAEHDLRKEVNALREELRAVGEDLAATTREQQMINDDLVSCASERDQLSLELNEARASNANSDAMFKAARREVEDVIAAYQELGSENHRLSAAASTLERANQRATLDRDASDTALEKVHARVRVLEEENRQFVIDIQAFERQVESLSRALANTEHTGVSANQETSQLNTQLAAAHALATELGRARDQLQRDLAAADSNLHVMRTRLADSQGESETVSQRLRIETKRVHELESLLAANRAREHIIDVSSVDTGQQMSLLKERNRALEEQIHELEKQSTTLQSNCQDMETQSEQFRGSAVQKDILLSSIDTTAATVSLQQSTDLHSKLIDADRRAEEQSNTIANLSVEATRSKQVMLESIAEAAVAQQQASMTRRELAAAVHRESVLVVRAEEAEEIALEFKRAQQEAEEEKEQRNSHSWNLSEHMSLSVKETCLDDADLRAVAIKEGDNPFRKETEMLREKNTEPQLLQKVYGLLDTDSSSSAVLKLKAEHANAIERRVAVEADFQALTHSAESLKAMSVDTVDPRQLSMAGQFEERISELHQENALLRGNLAGTEEACEKMEKELKRIQKEYNDLAQSFANT